MSGTPPRRFFVADTGLLWNFAVIDRLDLLESFVTRTGRPPVWAEKVRSEIEFNIPDYLNRCEEIFGDALVPEGEEEALVFDVQTNFFMSSEDSRAQHLGESQSIAICSQRFEAEIVFMLTEDRRVRDFCTATQTPDSRHLRMVTPQVWQGMVTRTFLEAAVSEGTITAEGRNAYYAQLREAERPLIDPPPKLQWPRQ